MFMRNVRNLQNHEKGVQNHQFWDLPFHAFGGVEIGILTRTHPVTHLDGLSGAEVGSLILSVIIAHRTNNPGKGLK